MLLSVPPANTSLPSSAFPLTPATLAAPFLPFAPMSATRPGPPSPSGALPQPPSPSTPRTPLSRRASRRVAPTSLDGVSASIDASSGTRSVLLNAPSANAGASFIDNSLRSAKYTPLNLLPKALFEQFRRVANFYFLIVAAVSFIPDISPTTPIANVIPLLVVVGFGFARDVWEDLVRARSDAATNAQPQAVLVPKSDDGGSGSLGRGFEETKLRKAGLDPALMKVVRSRDIRVGDIVVVLKGADMPADMVLLASAAEGGVAYVSTASLDGESNLKRLVVAAAVGEGAGGADLVAMQGWIKCQAPDMSLHNFQGSMSVVSGGGAEKVFGGNGDAGPKPLDSSNLMLRGSVLRNTAWVMGMAVYTGAETKISLNMRHPPSKMGTTEKKLNWVVFALFVNLLILVLVAAIAGGALQGQYGQGQWYMGDYRNKSAWSVLARGLGTFLVLFSTYIPVSLFVTLEFVRVLQALFMGVDAKMTTKGKPVAAKATNLNEVLGQIQFVLSDKTGTLTENVMRYIACSAGGKVYDISKKRNAMTKAVSQDVRHVKDLVLAMALCHGVVPEPKENEDEVVGALADGGSQVPVGQDAEEDLPEYQGQSPDEVALVTSAREYGVSLIERTLDTMVIDRFGTEERYEVLAELEFNSDRKRMSVIFRCPDGKIRLFCKGADTIMMPLLQREPEVVIAQEHIDVFATQGLRTLVYASKTFEDSDFDPWYKDFESARNLLTGREEAVAGLSSRAEVDMVYIAVTAVEDKLQDQVPETIKFLREARVGLWVLTGDKRETAENIGYSANLLDRDMNVVHIQASSSSELEAQLADTRRQYVNLGFGSSGLLDGEEGRMLLPNEDSDGDGGDKASPTRDVFPDDANSPRTSNALRKRRTVTEMLSPRSKRLVSMEQSELAIIIDGASLAYAIEDHPDALMDLADSCKTVICCRVTPLQKALVVRMVREMRASLTLAIGDGGNDVSMIQEAHVGVGLFGKEGTQAARAGDYAMSEFKHLQRLMSVHGRYAYIRSSGTINLSFYKNIVFTATQVFFQIFNFSSGTTFQDQWIVSFFNVVITALSPLLYGVFERDLDEGTLRRFPEAYASNRGDRLFSVRSVAEYTFLYGLWHAITVFFGVFFAMGYLAIPFADGRDGGLYMTALGSAFIIVIVVLIKFLMHSHTWNWVILLAIVFSFLMFFVTIPVAILGFGEYALEGTLEMLLRSNQFILTGAMIIAACFVVDFAILAVRQLLYPDVVNNLQIWEKDNRRERAQTAKEVKIRPMGAVA